jgi:hypothetical protein
MSPIQGATSSLAHGERVSPKATGEGSALPGKGAPLIRPFRGHLLPMGEGLAEVAR